MGAVFAKFGGELAPPPGVIFRKYNQNHDERGRFSSGDGGGGSGDNASGSGGGSGGTKNQAAAAAETKNRWVAESKIKTTGQVIEAATRNQRSLASAADQIANEVGGGTRFVNPGVKSEKRINEKIAEGRSPAAVTDAVRGGFMINEPDQADQIIGRLRGSFDVADEGWAVTPAGYFDRKVLVRFDDGQIGEVQFWHPAMFDAKENGGGHKLYEKARSLPPDHPEKGKATADMRNLYGGVTDQLSPAWKAVAGKA